MRIIRIIRLNIRFKLIIAFIALSVIPAVIIGFISIISNISSYKEIAINNLSEDVYVIKSQLDNFSTSLEEKINFFTASKSFNDFTTSVANEDTNGTYKAIETILPGLLAWIAFSVPLIFVNGSYIISVISDPFGWGWNLFGTADFH